MATKNSRKDSVNEPEQQPLLSKVLTKDTDFGSTLSGGGSSNDGDADEEAQADAALNLPLPSYQEEALDIFKLGVPIFIARLSWVGMKTTDTALLGHVSREALSASALSDLWTMCTQVLMNGRILTVLVGGAVGAGNPKLAGIYLQVSYVVLASISIFVFICWNVTEQVWLAFGSDAEISKMAGYYARILSLAIPGILAFGQLSQFFSAQRIMHPEVNASMFGLAMNLILGLVLVVGWPIPGFHGYQFAACPIVTSAVTYVQLAVMWYIYIHIQQLHAPCWDGWNFKEVTMDRVRTFCDLYIPAALSSASDFTRVAVIGAIAAKLGEEEVAVFNTSYRIMWIALSMVGSLSGGAAINMSIRLGRNDPNGAKQAGYVGIYMSTILLISLISFILLKSRWFGKIFTNDEVFLDMFEEASFPFTITLFFMNLAVAMVRIPYSMGRTKEVFWMGFIASWLGQVPGVWVCVYYWRKDLIGLYTGMAIGYGLLVVLYGYIIIRCDWKMYAELAQKRSEVTNTKQESK